MATHNNLQYITKFLPQYIDTVFAEDARTQVLLSGNKQFRFESDLNQAKTVKIMSLYTSGLGNYLREGTTTGQDNYSSYPNQTGYPIGGISNNWESFTLKYDRASQFRLDARDDVEIADMLTKNVFDVFTRTQVIPEVDAIRFSKLVSYANPNYANLVAEDLTAANIYDRLLDGMTHLSEMQVPQNDQIIFMSIPTLNLLRKSNQITRFINSDSFLGNVKFEVFSIDGRPIIPVPTDRFLSEIEVKANGYLPGANAKPINFIICSKSVALPIVIIDQIKIFNPQIVQDFDGYKINYRMLHDLFVPNNKTVALYVSLSDTGVATTKQLFVDVVEAPAGGQTIVKNYITKPGGIQGRLVRSATAFQLGQVYQVNAQNVEVILGVPYTKLGNTEFFAILDNYSGMCLAVSKGITVFGLLIPNDEVATPWKAQAKAYEAEIAKYAKTQKELMEQITKLTKQIPLTEEELTNEVGDSESFTDKVKETAKKVIDKAKGHKEE